jgi:hypothetical protein
MLNKRLPLGKFFTVLFLLSLTCSAWAGSFSLVYEKVITDSRGNEIGTQKQVISSPDQLPYGSPWRDYLAQKVDHRDFFTYAKDLSAYFSQPMTLNISDRNATSCSGKNSNGFFVTLNKHVTQFSSVDSKKFVFLHEMGHVAMLNAYPNAFDFSGLNYGGDNAHYLDEILPNHKTAWVEGWANCFAATKNGGKVFSLNLNEDSTTAFLRGNTFEEMTRNELFIGKNLYDIMKTFSGGQDKVFNTLSRTGPHYSLEEFCRSYIRLYPGDQVNLAKLLNKTSYGKISLDELLRFVNNGSRTVSQGLYTYLKDAGKLSTSVASNQSSGSSFWASIKSFFANLFGGSKSAATSMAAAPSVSSSVSIAPAAMTTSGSENVSLTPSGETFSAGEVQEIPSGSTSSSVEDLAAAQENYYKAFRAYNQVMIDHVPDSAEAKAARDVLKAAKRRLEEIRKSFPRE